MVALGVEARVGVIYIVGVGEGEGVSCGFWVVSCGLELIDKLSFLPMLIPKRRVAKIVREKRKITVPLAIIVSWLDRYFVTSLFK